MGPPIVLDSVRQLDPAFPPDQMDNASFAFSQVAAYKARVDEMQSEILNLKRKAADDATSVRSQSKKRAALSDSLTTILTNSLKENLWPTVKFVFTEKN